MSWIVSKLMLKKGQDGPSGPLGQLVQPPVETKQPSNVQDYAFLIFWKDTDRIAKAMLMK